MTAHDPDDLADLEAKARAALQASQVGSSWSEDVGSFENAVLLGALTPEVVIDIIERLRDAEAHLEGARKQNAAWRPVVERADAAESRIAELEAALRDAGENLQLGVDELAKSVEALREIGKGDCFYGYSSPAVCALQGRCAPCIARNALAAETIVSQYRTRIAKLEAALWAVVDECCLASDHAAVEIARAALAEVDDAHR